MMKIANTPPRLPKNGTIGIVNVGAPEPVEFSDRFNAGLARLKEMGFSVVEADHIRRADGYASAAPAKVAADFNAMWADKSVDAILCAGGGITANALLPYLDFELFSEVPKILVGASNPTVLLNAITAVSSVATFHGPSVVWDFGDPDQPSATRDSFSAILINGDQKLGVAPKVLRSGSATGPLFGGNLTSLLHLAGTRWMPQFDSAILIWEDIGEDTAHLASKLTHLAELGVLDRLAAMIVGELVDCAPSAGIDAEAMVLDICAKFAFPIVFGLPFGHTPLKVILPLGVPVYLGQDGSLELVSVVEPDRHV
jgi:muramoyltetrapeptide carboxypeptidase